MTQGLPDFPTRKSLEAKIRKYAIAAHKRGDHKGIAKPNCPICMKDA